MLIAHCWSMCGNCINRPAGRLTVDEPGGRVSMPAFWIFIFFITTSPNVGRTLCNPGWFPRESMREVGIIVSSSVEDRIRGDFSPRPIILLHVFFSDTAQLRRACETTIKWCSIINSNNSPCSTPCVWEHQACVCVCISRCCGHGSKHV